MHLVRVQGMKARGSCAVDGGTRPCDPQKSGLRFVGFLVNFTECPSSVICILLPDLCGSQCENSPIISEETLHLLTSALFPALSSSQPLAATVGFLSLWLCPFWTLHISRSHTMNGL